MLHSLAYMGASLAGWLCCSCLEKVENPTYRSHNHILRLLNPRTFAHYFKLVIWIGSLILLDQVIHLITNSTITAMSPIIMFLGIFAVLEASRRFTPGFQQRFNRFAGPGNALLNQWIALMFFVFTVSLPYALRDIPVLTIVGWAASIILGTVIQAIGTSYFVVAWNRFFPEKSDDQIGLVVEDSVEMPHKGAGGAEEDGNEKSGTGVKFEEVRNRGMERASRKRADSRLTAGAAEFASEFLNAVASEPTEYDEIRQTRVTEAFFDDQGLAFFDIHQHFFQDTDQIHAKNPRAESLMTLLKDELHNGYTNVAQHLTAVLEADFADDENVKKFLELEHGEYDAELAGDGGEGEIDGKLMQKKIEPESAKVQIFSYFDVMVVFSGLAVLSAILFLFDQSNPKPYVFTFQFVATIAIHVAMTSYRSRLLGWLPPKLLAVFQPALVVIALLILMAGGTWPHGFMAGLNKYRLRKVLSTGKNTIFHTVWWEQSVGPGEIVGILLNPAIATLAFPTSSAMKTLGKKIPIVVVGSFWSAILSYFTMALLAFLLVGDDGVSLSLLPHSVSTAVAIGLEEILCDNGTCAVGSIIATTCIVTGVIQMIFGGMLQSLVKVEDPVARGIAIGSSGMALGVAGLKKNGEMEAAGAAAMAYAVFAVSSAILVLIPGFVGALASIATAYPASV